MPFSGAAATNSHPPPPDAELTRPAPSMMHVGLGRKHPLHVEYMMTEAILSHPRLHLQRRTALVRALNKVIWVPNDLMAKWHVRDGAEFETGDSDIEAEREGHVYAKEILSEGLEDDADTAGPSVDDGGAAL